VKMKRTAPGTFSCHEQHTFCEKLGHQLSPHNAQFPLSLLTPGLGGEWCDSEVAGSSPTCRTAFG